jgi:hypothetical protein
VEPGVTGLLLKDPDLLAEAPDQFPALGAAGQVDDLVGIVSRS